ncbi:VanZ family protein [Clostridium sp. 1001271B_151109_B4]|uniref:VanZ family protein n=1 Tax=Clostridium sp. 1001271B_151109_B4 TaxID=2787148 RepID=UPI001FAE20A5|nr:VanZ family protein [Clostridium sp. 1001271B_151109_B4]
MMKSYLLAILVSMVLVTILNIILNKKSNKPIKLQHYLFGYMLMFYLVISLKDIVGFPTLSDFERRIMVGASVYNPVLNFIPFSSGIEISTILNIIFFMPFGFLLPTLWKRFRKFIPTVFAGFIFSLIIEVGQLFTFRATDVDDLIMNTLGTILGFIVFKIFSIIFKKLSSETVIEEYNKKGSIVKYGPYLYIGIAVVSVFFC